MTITEQIREILPELTKAERKAAEYIMINPFEVVRYGSSDAIANLCGGSRNAIIRLTKKLGFNGFSDFKYQMAKEMNEVVTYQAEKATDYYAHVISDLKLLEDSEEIRKAARMIRNARTVYAYGYAHSGYAARQFVFRCVRNGKQSVYIDGALGLDNYPNIMNNEDVIVIFSISGDSTHHNFTDQLQNLREHTQAKVILFSMEAQSPAQRICDVLLKLPCVSRMGSSFPLDDNPTFAIATEILLKATHDSE